MLATEECKKMPEKHDEKWITLFRTVNIIWFWKCTQKWNIPSFLALFKKKKFYLGYTGWGGDQSAIERLETSCLQSIPKCWLLMLPTAEAESQRQTDATEHVQFSTRCHSFSNLPSIQKHGNELGFSLTLKGAGRKFTQEWKFKARSTLLTAQRTSWGGKPRWPTAAALSAEEPSRTALPSPCAVQTGVGPQPSQPQVCL